MSDIERGKNACSSLFVFIRILCVKTATYEKGYFFSEYETNVVTLPVVTEKQWNDEPLRY